MSGTTQRKTLTALEWLRVTHADTLSGRRIEEAVAAARAEERQRWTTAVETLAEEMSQASRLPISSEFDRGVAAHQRDAAARLRRRPDRTRGGGTVSASDCPAGRVVYGDRPCEGPGTYYCDELVCDPIFDRRRADAVPPADVTREPTGGQELREALSRLLDHFDEYGDPYDLRDAVLALPELAALLADAERVRRVREVHRLAPGSTRLHCQGCATHVTFTPWPCATIRALDGEPQP